MIYQADPAVIEVLTDVIKYTAKRWAGFEATDVIGKEAFLAIPIPDENRSITTQGVATTKPLYPLLTQQGNELIRDEHVDNLMGKAAELLGCSEITNGMVYGAGSYLDWHTDTHNTGTRIYYTFSKGESIFKYRDVNTGVITSITDTAGWVARKFDITPRTKPLWHSVWTEKQRFSFGFKV